MARYKRLAPQGFTHDILLRKPILDKAERCSLVGSAVKTDQSNTPGLFPSKIFLKHPLARSALFIVGAVDHVDNLVLDLGGVIVHDPMHELLAEINRLGSASRKETEEWYLREIRHPLWSGTMSEEVFWEEIIHFTSSSEGPEYFRSYIKESLRLMPAGARLKELAENYTLYALSNHRHEWIGPVLEEKDLNKYFKEVFISSEIGEVKPDPEVISLVLRETEIDPSRSFYVDDNEQNLLVAEEASFQVLHADPDGDWVERFLEV